MQHQVSNYFIQGVFEKLIGGVLSLYADEYCFSVDQSQNNVNQGFPLYLGTSDPVEKECRMVTVSTFPL